MKVVPIEAGRKGRSLVTVIGLLSLPIFAAIFYLLYTMVRRMSPGTSLVVLLAGAGFVGYLAWIFARARK
jgi:threonine dehydrogenase-like Zn-dependent dehydrogenase